VIWEDGLYFAMPSYFGADTAGHRSIHGLFSESLRLHCGRTEQTVVCTQALRRAHQDDLDLGQLLLPNFRLHSRNLTSTRLLQPEQRTLNFRLHFDKPAIPADLPLSVLQTQTQAQILTRLLDGAQPPTCIGGSPLHVEAVSFTKACPELAAVAHILRLH
jgi:hypothetical protein